MLCSRFVRYLNSCLTSSKHIVSFLANLHQNDLRTPFGRNVHGIAVSCNSTSSSLSPGLVKSRMKYAVIPEEEVWRVSLILEILDSKLDIPLDSEEIEEILAHACIS